MSRVGIIGVRLAALAASLAQTTHAEAQARGLLQMMPDRPEPFRIPKPDNPMALLGKHAGRLRRSKQLWRR